MQGKLCDRCVMVRGRADVPGGVTWTQQQQQAVCKWAYPNRQRVHAEYSHLNGGALHNLLGAEYIEFLWAIFV